MTMTLTAIKGTRNNVRMAEIKLTNFVLMEVSPSLENPYWSCDDTVEPQPILLRNLSSLNMAMPLMTRITTYNNFPRPNMVVV